MSEQLFAQLLVSGLGMGFIFALIAIGLTLIYGVMDVVNFAHGEFLMVAMYASFFAWQAGGVDPIVAVPVVAAAMFAFGVGVYWLLVRRVLGKSMHSQIFATFGLMVFLQALAQFVFGADYRAVQQSVLSGVVEIGGIALPCPQLASMAVSANSPMVTISRITKLSGSLRVRRVWSPAARKAAAIRSGARVWPTAAKVASAEKWTSGMTWRKLRSMRWLLGLVAGYPKSARNGPRPPSLFFAPLMLCLTLSKPYCL